MKAPLLTPSPGVAFLAAHAVVALLLLLLPGAARAEFRRFDGPIDAASNYIHYSEGYVVTPGFVDISSLVFQTADGDGGGGGSNGKLFGGGKEREWTDDDEEGAEEDGLDDDGEYDLDDDGEFDGDDEGRARRRMDQDEKLASGSTYVDIVLFHEPPSCANTLVGCDWTELGVGASDGTGDDRNLRWCCSDDASNLGLCSGPKQEGRLIVDPDKFTGHHAFLGVPPSGEWKRSVKFGMFDLKDGSGSGDEDGDEDGEGGTWVSGGEDGTTGKYVLVVANCNDEMGRNLTVSGDYVWKSTHGYLPGNLFGEMYFFSALTALYLVLAVWYGIKMSIHRDEVIPIQKWMVGTILIGLLEVFFKSGDLWVWNVDGYRFWFSLYTGVVVGVLKRALSRCLVVMMCLGWGVTCDGLGDDRLARVVALGVAYAGSSAAGDVMTVLAITENEVLSNDVENDIWDVVTILMFVTAFVNVCFILWIFDALNGTMRYLEDMAQERKLKRYLRLRMILLLAVLFAVVWTVFGIVDSKNDQRIINEEVNGWVLGAVWEVNYLVVLVGLACLWAPAAGAKEYAYVMELSQMGNDLEFDTTIVDGPESDDEGGESGHGGFSDAGPADDGDDLDVGKGVHT